MINAIKIDKLTFLEKLDKQFRLDTTREELRSMAKPEMFSGIGKPPPNLENLSNWSYEVARIYGN